MGAAKSRTGPRSVEIVKDNEVLQENEINDIIYPDGTHLVSAPNNDIVRLICGGIDVHKKVLMAAAAITNPSTLKAVYYVKKFSTMNADISSMANWFKQHGVIDVVMESTGKYWIPVYNILEGEGLKPIVTHPKYVKQISGQKTDFRDAIHMANVFRMDLIISSFIPPADIRNMRDLCRYLMKLTYIRTSEKNRFQNSMTIAQIRLDSVFSDPFGTTASRIMDYILSTPKDQVSKDDIFKLIHRRVKAKPEDIMASIEGFDLSSVQRDKLLIVGQHIKDLDALIESVLECLYPYKEKYSSYIDLLKTIPGIGDRAALFIISEIGVDMSVWRNDASLASWAGLCPANNESAGKKKSTRIGNGGHYLKPVLVQCALAAIRSEKNSYYAIKYNRIRSRRGHKKAIIAIARMMITAIYHMISNGATFQPNDLNNEVKTSAKKVELTVDNTCDYLRELGVSEDLIAQVKCQCRK